MIKENKQIELLLWANYKFVSKFLVPFLETMLLP